MSLPGKAIQSELERIKKEIKMSYDGFKDNYDLFNEFRRFIYKSSLTSGDLTMMDNLGRPQLEFNILPAYLARLMGEFSKQEPSLEVLPDKPDQEDPKMVEVVDHHLQYVFNDSSNEHIKYNCYQDMMVGGWSVMKVMTEYANEMSMDQVIRVTLPRDPTLCGFDLLAKEVHKGDGRYCFDLAVWEKEEFKNKYPKIDLQGMSFRNDLEGFRWSYKEGVKDILLVADFYEKKKTKVEIARLDDNRVVTMREYKDIVENWTDITLPPAIIGKPRETEITKICRYRLIETKILEYEETDLPGLPLIFFAGMNSLIREEGSGEVKQMCLPYIYHAKDAQRLKNFAGMSLANEIENVLQHKFSVALEALPTEQPDWLNAYIDVQKANVLVHKTRFDDNPEMLIPNPVVQLQKSPAPPEILQAFQSADSAIQQTLGSYDASLGINDNQLSGIAVVEAATQSNAAAMPYIVGFMQGLQRVAQIYVDLLPKYIVTPRTIPLRNEKGERYYKVINQNNEPSFAYESNALQVHMKAGASFQVQKARTLNVIKEMMGMSPIFQQFIAEKGLNFVLDNMEGRGIDQLKKQVDEFVQQLQSQKQMAMQQQQQEMQQNPAMMRVQLDQQKLQLESEKMMLQHKIDMLKLQQEHHKIDADLLMSHNKDHTELEKAKIQNHGKMADIALKGADSVNKHALSIVDMHHTHERDMKAFDKEKDNEKKSTQSD